MVKEKKTISGLSSDFIFHPGDTLKEVLDDQNMSQYELSIRTGVSAKHISTVVSGEKGISISFAKKLEYALGIEASFWVNLQAKYEQDMFEYQEANSISKEELEVLNQLKGDVINDYLNNGWISHADSKIDRVLKFRKLLNVSDLRNLSNISSNASYRIHESINPYILNAFEKMCELKNKDVYNGVPLDLKKLEKSLEDIKKTMFLRQEKMCLELKRIFDECGISFNIVRNYKGAPVQGYIKKYRNRLLLCMTLRGKYIDIFWFTLFHEIGHILNKDYESNYVDFNNLNNQREKRADDFSRNALLKDEIYNQLLIDGNYRDIVKLKKIAKENNIDVSIVVGKLLKDGFVDYGDFVGYRKKYEWNELN